MTRNDYELIARVILEERNTTHASEGEVRDAYEDVADATLDSLTDRFCVMAEAQNPRFNRAIFRRAAGYRHTYDPWEDQR